MKIYTTISVILGLLCQLLIIVTTLQDEEFTPSVPLTVAAVLIGLNFILCIILNVRYESNNTKEHSPPQQAE